MVRNKKQNMKKGFLRPFIASVLCVFMMLPSCTGGGDGTTAPATGPAGQIGADTADVTGADTTAADTETDPVTEAPAELPYDNAHAYIFADPDKKSVWNTQGADVSLEFNVLKMVPTNHDPMIYCTFTEDEQFSAEEYPFVAYRYSAKTHLSRGVYFVSSTDHPQFSDDGLTWIDVKTRGVWTNDITDMRANNFWEGTITAFRIDPINGGELDKGAVIYLDRIGFFKTEEDARAFLNDAKEPDYSGSVVFSKDFAKALIPGGTLSAGYDSSDYLMKAGSAAQIRDGVTPVVAYVDGENTVPVPVSYVNSVGFISYMAERAGEYVLTYPEGPVETDGDFVLVRGVMTEAELSSGALSAAQAADILKRTLAVRGDTPALTVKDGAFTAEDAAEMIAAYLDSLGVSVYTDPDRRISGKSDGVNLAVGSGIITDISAKTVTGKAFASYIVRLIKAMLGQPVIPSAADGGKDGIVIGAWANFPFTVTDNTIRTMSECGISLLVDLGGIEQRQTLYRVLNSANKYGVKVLRYNYSPAKFKASDPDAIPASCYEYYDYASYYGNLIYDEPGTDKYDGMAALTEYYNASLPGKLCYYNLLPMYANAAQLRYGASAAQIAYYDEDPDLYKKYVESYAEKIRGDYMCVDIYPYRSNGKSKTMYSGYLQNMDIFAAACRKYCRDFWLYIQSTDYDGGRWTPDYNDIVWQMYIGLSFGVKTFIHFVYSWGGYDAFVLEDEPTDIYYAAQKADLEILAISDDYVRFKNVGAFSLNCDKVRYNYAKFDDQYKDFGIIKDIRSDDPVLVGCFEEKDGGGYAFTLVNMYDLKKPTKATVSFSLDGYDTVSAYIGGEKTELKAKDGVFTVELEAAAGAFIMVG